MKTSPNLTLPGTQRRITSVLSSKEMRSALAEIIGKSELASPNEMASPLEGMVYPLEEMADHISESHSPMDDIAFFDTNPALEAIVLMTGRPVLLVRNGVIEQADLELIEAMLKDIRTELIKPISAVGRIELINHETFDWCGTGFRIDEDLIITNRHVANLFAQRQDQAFKFRISQLGKPVGARIDFREEYKVLESEEFGIAEILWIADDASDAPDVAILQVKKDPGLPPPLSLASKKVDPGQPIAVVGYPARDSRNDPMIMSDVFKNIYDTKRFAPGEVVWPGEDTWFITHDASTLGGNSGSAVIDLASREVVGLHFGGNFRKTNYAVKASVIKSILAKPSWNVISHQLPGVPSIELSEKQRTSESMKDRRGYSEEFLGKTVALPEVGDPDVVLRTDLPGNLLPYAHFSILMSASRHFPIYTAENLDARLKIKLKRRDSWGFDPRIAKEAQVGHTNFYGPEPFDKGHMVRRENAGWGNTEEEAQLGEDDTFVYTNAVPQMPQLNQKTWLSLEDYVLDNAKTEGFKISVFTGPVFRTDDPIYSNVQVPVDFWKIVVAIDAETGELLASAYLLSQEGLMPAEGFRYGPFKTYQVPVKRIEELANLKFSKSIHEADVFSAQENTEMVATSRYIEINSADDIVLKAARIKETNMSAQVVFSPQEAEALLTKNEQELTELLALRVNAVQQDVSLSLQPTFEVQVSSLEEAVTLPPWIKNTVDAMIDTALRQSHNVLCSDLPEFADLRTSLVGALGLGGSAAVIALATFLTGTLGMAAALATILATIVIKKIGGPSLEAGHQTLCAELEKLLPK